MPVNVKQLKSLIELLEKHPSLAEIEVDGIRVAQHQSGAAPVTSTPVVHAAPVPSAPGPAPAEEPKAATPDNAITSPMVGTVYLAPSPEDPSFVSEGQTVAAGDTLCLVEAMKMFNKIKAGRGGVVKSILVENGQPVEFGQPLFVIE